MIPITEAPCAMPHVSSSPLPVPPTQVNLKSHIHTQRDQNISLQQHLNTEGTASLAVNT